MSCLQLLLKLFNFAFKSEFCKEHSKFRSNVSIIKDEEKRINDFNWLYIISNRNDGTYIKCSWSKNYFFELVRQLGRFRGLLNTDRNDHYRRRIYRPGSAEG